MDSNDGCAERRRIMALKAVIFDIDNTLIDFMKFKEFAVEEAIYAMMAAGLNKTRDEIWKVVDTVYKEKGIEYQHVFDDSLMELEGRIDYKKLAAAVSAYRKIKAGYMEPYANVIPTLIQLIKRGYKLGVISDAPKFQMWMRLCEMKLEHFFDFIISSEEVGELKPSPLPFRHALDILKMQPEEVMMIGDNYDRDVYGAKKMGMTAVLAGYGRMEHRITGAEPRAPKHTEIKPDYEIDDIREILDILE